MKLVLSTLFFVFFFGVNGFSNNHKMIIKPSMVHHRSTSSLHAWNPFLLADGADISDAVMMALPEAGGAVDIVKNIAVAITAVLFLFAGLTLVTAAIIVPAAAKELEQECKDLAPEMWEEYSAKLREGETMANRPDLMQELGAKLQPLLDAKIEKQFAEQKAKGIDVSKDEEAWRAIDSLNKKVPKPDNAASVFGTNIKAPAPTGIVADQWADDDGVVDAEVIQKTNK